MTSAIKFISMRLRARVHVEEPLTGVSITGEISGPRDERMALMLAGRDRVETDGRDDTCVAQSRLRGDDAVRDVVIDGLRNWFVSALFDIWKLAPEIEIIVHMRGELTECSSCLTSRTVPSLNVHLTISVSSEAPFTHSLLDKLLQKLEKS